MSKRGRNKSRRTQAVHRRQREIRDEIASAAAPFRSGPVTVRHDPSIIRKPAA